MRERRKKEKKRKVITVMEILLSVLSSVSLWTFYGVWSIVHNLAEQVTG